MWAVGCCFLTETSLSHYHQVDLLITTKITGIITQGAKDFGHVQFVGSFKLAFSNDGERWLIYQDEKQQKDKVGHLLCSTEYERTCTFHFWYLMLFAWDTILFFNLPSLPYGNLMSFIKITQVIVRNRWSLSHKLSEGHDIGISCEKFWTSQHFYDNLPPPAEESPPCFQSGAAAADKTKAFVRHKTPVEVLLWGRETVISI